MSDERKPPPSEEENLYRAPGPGPNVFDGFSTLNTQGSRPGIEDHECWWLDGFMPIGRSYIRTLPGVGLPIFTSGQPIPGPPSPPPPPPAACTCLPVGFGWGSDKGADVTLSNNNLTATLNSGASSSESVLSNVVIPPCNYYFEFTVNATAIAVGLYGQLLGPFNPPAPDIASVFDNNSFGYVSGNGSQQGLVGRMITPPAGWPTGQFGYGQIQVPHQGDIIQMCIRAGSTSRIWFNVNNVANNWNNATVVGTPSDPSSNTNPFTSGLGAGSYIAATVYGPLAQVTMNAGPNFHYTPPSGFGC